jgi:hypothetical protein
MPEQALSQCLVCISQQGFRRRRVMCHRSRLVRRSGISSRLAPVVAAALRARVRAALLVPPLPPVLLVRVWAEGPVISLVAVGVVAAASPAVAGVAVR